MRWMATIAAALGVLLARPALAEELVVAVPSTARPFTFSDAEGKLAGFNVDLGRLLCERLASACRIEPVSFPQLMNGIGEGRYHLGIGNTLKTPEREEKMLFSRPIWRSTTSLIGATRLEALPPDEALLRHRVCAVQQTRQAAWLSTRLPGPERLVQAATFREVFDALLAGRCDLALMPTVNALEFLTGAQGAGYDYYGPPLDVPQLSGTVHVVMPLGRPELRDAVDQAIDKIMLDGTYRALISRYFPFDIL